MKTLATSTGSRYHWRVLIALTLVILSLGMLATPARADTVRDLEYWLGDYGFTNAWTATKGKGVTVAVIDTGVASRVADLRGAVTDGTDVSGLGTADGQTPVGDDSDHGTMVASLLAGRGTGNGNGVIGVAPEASVLAISVAFGLATTATKSNDDQIAEAVIWAVDHGAKVINMSLTRNTRDWPESWDHAFSYAFAKDVVIVAAAGNRGNGTTEVGAPATIPGVLTVAGVNRGGVASFDASSQGISIAVAAPSEDLVGVRPDGSYVRWSGTSGAAPIVSGLVALVRAKYPDMDAANVINRVISTADPKDRAVDSPIYGHGLIDPVAALNAEVPQVDSNPLGSLEDWITLHRRAALDTQTVTPDEKVAIRSDPPAQSVSIPQTFLPTPWTLVYITVPLALVAGFGTLATLLCVAAARHLRRPARVGEHGLRPRRRT